MLSLGIMLLFTTIGFTILVYRTQISSEIQAGCDSTIGFYNDIDEIYVQGSKLLCSAECPCEGTSGVVNQYGATTLL